MSPEQSGCVCCGSEYHSEPGENVDIFEREIKMSANGTLFARAALCACPICQEHFLEEMGAFRRRLLAVEENAQVSVVPEVTRTHVKSVAEEAARAKGEQVPKLSYRVGTHTVTMVRGEQQKHR